jgi:hypothetical protein
MKNTDMVVDIDDEVVINLLRLFNENEGKKQLESQNINKTIINSLDYFGISSIANLLGAIKMAKYYEYNENDVVFTVATDSVEMYQSRLVELKRDRGEYTEMQANVDFTGRLMQIGTEDMLELGYRDRKRMHNLKYFTWVEQQGKSVEELNAQWYDEDYWQKEYSKVDEWDARITEFNERTGVIKQLG